MAPSPIISPRGQHADDEAQLLGLVHDVVHMTEISFVRLFRIAVHERLIAIGVCLVDVVQHARLDHGESLGCTIGQVKIRLLARDVGKQVPRGVGEIEERLPIRILEPAVIRADSQSWGNGRGGLSQGRAGDDDSQKCAEQEAESFHRERGYMMSEAGTGSRASTCVTDGT